MPSKSRTRARQPTCAPGASYNDPAPPPRVRRAEAQIKALFCRNGVEIFPCPGPDRRDSYFAVTVPAEEKPGRLYAGVAAQGRSPKVIFLRTYLALLGAAQKAFLANGGPHAPNTFRVGTDVSFDERECTT